VAAVGAHELADGGVLVPVGVVAVAAATGGGLAELVEVEGAGTTLLAEAGGAEGAPVGEAREEDLVPEEGEEEDGGAGEARGGDLEAIGGREEELGGGPEQEERQHQPRQHGGDAARPPLHDAQDAHTESLEPPLEWMDRLGPLEKRGWVVACFAGNGRIRFWGGERRDARCGGG
jgi:hypothetical protein